MMGNSQQIPLDKQKHLAAGILIGGISATEKEAKYPLWNAVTFSIICGVGKEVLDSYGGKADIKDIYYTAVGGTIGGTIVYYINKRSNQRRKKFGKTK